MVSMELESIKRMEENNGWLQDNYEILRQRYGNKFVAIDNGNVVGSADTAEELLNNLQEKKVETASVLIEFIPPKGLFLII